MDPLWEPAFTGTQIDFVSRSAANSGVGDSGVDAYANVWQPWPARQWGPSLRASVTGTRIDLPQGWWRLAASARRPTTAP